MRSLSTQYIFIVLICVIVLLVVMLPSSTVSYQFECEKEYESSVGKYRLLKSGSKQHVTFKDAVELLANRDLSTISSLSTIIAQHPSDAVFWECAPITPSEFDTKPFEFVLLPASHLATAVVDMDPFMQKFQLPTSQGKDVIVFKNLGGDSTLIVPTPPSATRDGSTSAQMRSLQHMTHLSAFVKGAQESQIVNLFGQVGTEMLREVAEASVAPNKELWLSTSGMGVSWLHVRIDSVPKYYNWKEYKQ